MVYQTGPNLFLPKGHYGRGYEWEVASGSLSLLAEHDQWPGCMVENEIKHGGSAQHSTDLAINLGPWAQFPT